MKTESILFTAPHRAEVVAEDVPALKSGEVLVKLARSAISSGTERSNYVGDPDVSVFGYEAPFPRRVGYSSSGVVVETAPDVRDLKAGDRVALSWSKHTRYNVMPASRVYRLPDDLSFEDAAWTHIATFPMAAIRKCGLEFGESALVMGQGVLGALAVRLLRTAGAVPVIAADPLAARRDAALAGGADAALDPLAADFAAQVKALTSGGARCVIEVTGVGAALNTALDAIARYGRLALLGCTRRSDFTLDYYHKVHGAGVTLVGAHTMARPERDSARGWWTERDDAQAFLSLMAGKRLSLAGFTERVCPYTTAAQVFEELASGGTFPTTEFDWQ